jgi:hypothetical protein
MSGGPVASPEHPEHQLGLEDGSHAGGAALQGVANVDGHAPAQVHAQAESGSE